jgi:3-isopropylmalate/(R)-2-methylmalate dehydratase small subunit
VSAKVKNRLTDLDEMSKYIMEDIRPGFYSEIKPGDFIVAGINFGCGSSREAAPSIIKRAGISAVIAKGYARIFFRNSINIGLLVLYADTSNINEGDRLKINLNDGKIEDTTTGIRISTQSIPPFIKGIVDEGGIKNYLKKHPNFEGV